MSTNERAAPQAERRSETLAGYTRAAMSERPEGKVVPAACEWCEIEVGSGIYNTCKDEFHLADGYELWPHCHWCGRPIKVVDEQQDAAAPNNSIQPNYRQIALDLLHGDEAHLAAIVDGSATADDTESASAKPQMTAERFRSRNAAHAELLQIHRICMDVANCPPVTEGDTLTIRYVKDLAAIVNRLSVPASETNVNKVSFRTVDLPRKTPSPIIGGLDSEPNAAAAQASGDPGYSGSDTHDDPAPAAAPTLAPLDQNERAARLSLPVPPDVLCSAMQDVVHNTPATPSKLPLSADRCEEVFRSYNDGDSMDLWQLKWQAIAAIELEQRVAELERENASIRQMMRDDRQTLLTQLEKAERELAELKARVK